MNIQTVFSLIYFSIDFGEGEIKSFTFQCLLLKFGGLVVLNIFGILEVLLDEVLVFAASSL